MSDYQHIIDRVRGFVGGADQTRNDALIDLSTAFAALCTDANTRLRRCADYLHRGLRSEAIHFAESQPSLLNLIGALDFPEFADWESLCAAYDLARPQRMMLELAEELNEAYAQEQPLQSLLGQHRLLAVARAPLRDRLEVLRQLAAADPLNPCWQEDQSTFEKARLRELRGEVAAAVKAHDDKSVAVLATEVLQRTWTVEIDPEMRETLGKAFQQVQGKEAILNLQALVPQMRRAIDAGSLSQGKQLLEQWQKVVSKLSTNIAEPLKDEMRSLRTWVGAEEGRREQRAAFEDECKALRLALDTHQPEGILRIHHRAITDSGIAPPVELEREYRGVVGRLERARRMEHLAVYALIIIVTLVVIGIGLIIWSRAKGTAH